MLAVLPTGAGKSLPYQLAAQLLPGVTLVVTPLLALMKDQVESLRERGIPAVMVSSAQSAGEAAAALDDVERAAAKLLYVTPERFDDADFVAAMRRLQVALFVVDEAHCVSEWGHSFRPAYLSLGQAAAQLGRPTLLALTATATPWVRQDVIQRLGLRAPDVVVRDMDRPNLFLEVVRVEEEREDRRVLERLLRDAGGNAAESIEARALAGAGKGWMPNWRRRCRAAASCTRRRPERRARPPGGCRSGASRPTIITASAARPTASACRTRS